MFSFLRKPVKKDVSTLLSGFRDKGYHLFGGMEHASHKLVWGDWIKMEGSRKDPQVNDDMLFSRLSLFLAMHDFNFPLGSGRSVDQAFTDGDGDCGIDGIALAVGNTTIYTCDDVCRVIEEDPKAPVRLLFHKSRLPDDTEETDCEADIETFKKDILFWLAEPEAQIEDKQKKGKHSKNKKAIEQWRNYNCILKCFEKMGRDFNPEVTILFNADGQWKDRTRSVKKIKEIEGALLEKCPAAVVRADIWGRDQLTTAAEYARVAVNRVMHNFNSVKMPTIDLPDDWNSVATQNQPVKIQGYIGYIPAQDLLRVFLKEAAEGDTSIPGLDYRFFRDSPRHYHEIEAEGDVEQGGIENWNVGGREIEKSIKGSPDEGVLPGQGALIGYGHNGVVIVSRKALLKPGTKEAQLSKIDSLELVSPQVVNGAQTCFIMHKNWNDLPGVFVPLKVIVSANYNVKDYIIAASNTQHKVDEWDMFTRRAEVRTFQRRIRHCFSTPETAIWLQRRRNKPFEEVVDLERMVLARDLLEATVSCFYHVPHLVQDDPKQFLRRNHGDIRFGKQIFNVNHIVKAYQAIGWLLISSKKFRKALDKDAPYLLRNFHVYALWRLIDQTPDHVDLMDLTSEARYAKDIDAVLTDLNQNNGALVTQAANIVWEEIAAGHQGADLTKAIIARTSRPA